MTVRKPNLPALCVAVLISGCGESGPPLTVTDAVAVAPLPGTQVSAAYLTLHNHSKELITIHRVSSPDFARVEMHESTTVDDVVHMRRLDSVTIEAGSSTRFVPGGKHLMLLEPVGGLIPGDSVMLRFGYDADDMLVVITPVKTRM